MKTIFLGILLSCFICRKQSFAAEKTHFSTPNTPGFIGETGHLYLIDEGLFARPFYNDGVGYTDKHLTGLTQVGYITEFSENYFELVYNWRFITPASKAKFGTPNFSYPIGRYADWIELQGAWSKIYRLGEEILRLQINIGVGDIGHHGARETQRAFHKILGVSLFGTDYDEQPAGKHGSYGFELGLITGKGLLFQKPFESLLSLGVNDNIFMTEVFLNQNQILEIKNDLLLALETRAIRQLDSIGYLDQQLASRFELATGMRWKWYRPSVKYVSPFLKNDEVGQLFLDLFAFYLRF